ncbi:hypothetical protein [Paracoccus sp. J39]|uniref:hypothetical protein n=2 Tax=Paracoccus TaxID=265 RepID=UPI00048CB8F9|nr:hypothetical protein [Paracoccus sp. J39]
MSKPVEMMPRAFAGGMPVMMADYLRAIELCQRVLAEVPAIGNTPLACEIRELLADARRPLNERGVPPLARDGCR